MNENEISKIILDTAFSIHKKFGPGLLESVYEELLCYEFDKQNIRYKRQIGIPVVYEDVKLEIGFRADIIGENKVIIDLPAASRNKISRASCRCTL